MINQTWIAKLFLRSLEVIIPPGNADCTLQATNYSLEVVRCQANTGSHGNSVIICYQNSRKAPNSGEITQTAAKINAEFWISTSLPLACCSMTSVFMKEPETCDDFVFPSKAHIPKSEKEIELSTHDGSTVPTAPVTDQKMKTHSCTDIPSSVHDTDIYLHPSFVKTVTGLLVVCLLMVVSNILLVIFCVMQNSRKRQNGREEENPTTDSLCTTPTHWYHAWVIIKWHR